MTAAALHLSVQYATTSEVPARAQVRRWVAGALAMLPDVRAATLAVRFVDADEGRSLNRTFRRRDYATNVLTFPYDQDASSSAPVGADIVICMPVLEAEALAQHKTLSAHVAHLVVHGVLHAAGHDHEVPQDAEAMERLERDVLARFRIGDPYRDDVRV